MSTRPFPNAKLKAVREQRGWSQVQVSQFLEIGSSTYANWEYGIRPGERNINKLRHLFRKTPEELGF